MILEISDLSFSYPKHPVLQNISLSAKGGEFISLLGNNGSGKTTLFKSILGLLKVKSGSVSIDGENLNNMSIKERAKKTAYIPQETKQVFAYSVLSQVLMGCTANISTLASPGEKEVQTALDALKTLGIEHLKDRNINALSGGERQLVLCARALAGKAKCLLFDEPTASLDYGNQISVLSIIHKLTKSGYLAIVSTHNVEQALNFSTRIILLNNKQITFNGTPEQLVNSDILECFYMTPLSVIKIDGRYYIKPESI